MQEMEIKYGEGRDAFLKDAETLLGLAPAEDVGGVAYNNLLSLRKKVKDAADGTVIELTLGEVAAYRACRMVRQMGAL